ncbi:MAG: PQQ-dependent sugar dehydrogenase [Chloroflexota bacterium]|nr:PQQ-dependent sugar dehydrogenase [Chloroflexota bacterium]
MNVLRSAIALLLVALIGASGLFAVSAQEGTDPGFTPPQDPFEGISVAQPGGSLPGDPQIQLVQVASGLLDPVNVTSANDGSGRLFVVERVGFIRIIDPNGQVMEEPFLDITRLVGTWFLEQGLLGLTFHPDYVNNGLFYVYYIDYRTNGDSFVVEYRVSADNPNQADPDSARVILTVEQPFVNHNGGTINFGPDGYLYISLGDGGLAGDPYETAQDVNDVLGSILRIDVNAQGDAPYRIPENNPFSQAGGVQPEGEYLETGILPSDVANQEAQDGSYHPEARPEIFFWGLRNPWQFSFDAQTGDLYVTDVGQNAWEEINFVPAGTEGGWNFGWDFMEGAHCYPPAQPAGPATPEAGGEEIGACSVVGVPPVAEYSHEFGCSITGMGVYRGEAFPALQGIYFNSDFCSGRIWGLARDDAGTWQYAELLQTSLLATGSGTDETGNVYLTACECEFNRDYDPFENPSGTLWRVVPADQVPEGAVTAPTPEPEEGATPEAEVQDEQPATPEDAVADEGMPATPET